MAHHHRVYVIELSPNVLYVGMTGLRVPERIEQHRLGYRSSRVVHQHRDTLQRRPDLEPAGPLGYDECVLLEGSHAAALQAQGFTVHGGH